MARETQARGASTRPQDTSTLLWLGVGALGVTAIVLGMSALAGSSTDQPTKTPITAKAKSAAVANATPNTNPPSPAQSASQNPGQTQKITQRPAIAAPPTQTPTQEQLARQAERAWESPMPAERPQSALQAYFYDLQVHRTDRNDFIQGIMDSEVTWVGYLRSVRHRQNRSTLLMAAIPSANTFDIAYIDFTAEFSEKLSDLAAMDKVRIKGFYRGGGPMPHVEGTSVELVEE